VIFRSAFFARTGGESALSGHG